MTERSFFFYQEVHADEILFKFYYHFIVFNLANSIHENENEFFFFFVDISKST